MAFRDEREALRFQIAGLEREIAEHVRQREEHQQAAAVLDAEIDHEVKLVHGKLRLSVVAVSVLGVVAAGAAFLSAGGSSDAEVLFGDVEESSGETLARQGARCTLFVTPVDDSDAPYDTDIEVLCDGRLVYGGDSLGGVDCEKQRNHAVRCVDDDFTADGGDPKLRFDRSAGTVVIEDRAPAFRLRIALSPPPMSL